MKIIGSYRLTLIETLIAYYLPQLNKFLTEKDFTIILIISIKGFVCLFSQTLKPEMVYNL